MTFLPLPGDQSEPYFRQCGEFRICKAHTPSGWVYTATRRREILKSGTWDECVAACEAYA